MRPLQLDTRTEDTIRTDQGPASKLAVTRLTLTRFRCYEGARLNADTRPVVLTGPNGAGKTNLLEAVSFLSPGRGLRRARLADVERIGGPRAGRMARK